MTKPDRVVRLVHPHPGFFKDLDIPVCHSIDRDGRQTRPTESVQSEDARDPNTMWLYDSQLLQGYDCAHIERESRPRAHPWLSANVGLLVLS